MTFSPSLSRRRFLGALGAGAAIAPLTRGATALAASPGTASAPLFVLVFLRGALDALNTLVPYADPDYARLRPSIAVAAPGKPEGVLPLDDHFGLNPRLAPLLPAWKSGRLALLHAVGSPSPTRSHFDAQDRFEAGVTEGHGDGGFLARALATVPPSKELLSVVALGGALPGSLDGDTRALVLPEGQRFGLGAPREASRSYADALASLYPGSSSDRRVQAGHGALATLERLRALQESAPEPDRSFPKTPLGRQLGALARLVHAGADVRVATLDVGGWDTHSAEGAHEGRLGRALAGLADALSAFDAAVGDRATVLCVSEFGRTAAENGARGTDHGHGTLALALGAGVRGGLHGNFPGLAREALYEGRDLAVTTDFRDLLAEAAARRLGVTALDRLLPGFAPSAARFPGMFTALA